jgi:ubiquinol-cytochrome c reductase cytochrome b subunit
VALLGWLGGMPAEQPYVLLSQLGTIYYFLHFLVIVPLVSSFERPEPLPFSITESVLGHDGQAKLGAKD